MAKIMPVVDLMLLLNDYILLHDSSTLMYCRHNQEKGSARCKRKQ